MKLHLIIIWRLCSMLIEETVSCMPFPGLKDFVDNEFNIVVAGGNFFNDTSFSELSDVEYVTPFWKDSLCTKPNRMPSNLDGTVSGHVEGQPMVCGGLKSESSDENGFEQTVERDCHSLKGNEWELQTGGLRCPRWGASSLMLDKDKMWVVGGNPDSSSSEECLDAPTSSEIFNSNLGEFELTETLPEPMIYHCTARIDENHIFMVNGYDENYEGISHAYVVDTSTKPMTFMPLPSLNKVRSQAACGIITYTSDTENENNLAIVVAGGGFGNDSRSTEIYKLSDTYDTENTWEPGPILPRGFANGCQINSDVNGLILIGGFDEFGNVRSDLIQYNSNSEQFETLPGRLNTPRYGCTAVRIQNTGECVKT